LALLPFSSAAELPSRHATATSALIGRQHVPELAGRELLRDYAPTHARTHRDVALMLVVVAATVFVKTKPGGSTGVTGVGAGPGFYVFAVACVVGIFAAQLASKLFRPPDPDSSL
jgi:hypothetical protein